MAFIEKKIPNGKLVRVQVHFKNNRISHIKITGDFFMHPEDAIIGIESSLLNSNINDIDAEVEKAFNKSRVVCVGFLPAHMAAMIKEAYACGE